MAEALDRIIEEDIRLKKYGINNKQSLVINILGKLIARYEDTNEAMTSIKDSIKDADPIPIKDTEPDPTFRSRAPHEKINRLLDVIEHHMEEKDCKHTLMEILKEWFPQSK